MNENNNMDIEVIEDMEKKSKRIYWIDHARGFIMIWLVIAMFLPTFLREGVLRFFLDHPVNQTTTTTMNLYDVGAPAFIFVMGLLMSLSFFRRKERDGVGNAIRHILIRYGIILALGLFVVFIDRGSFITVTDGMVIINWDVLPTLGLCGLIALPFLWLKSRYRAIIASLMLIFYQIMLFCCEWRNYAMLSVHGGILGTIFGFSALMIISTCLGDILFVNKDFNNKEKYQIYAIVGIACFLWGTLLAFIPEWYPNKRQVTLAYILVSLGTSILLSFLFIGIDTILKKPIFILDSYGKNPLLIYIVAVVIEFIIEDVIGYEIDLIVGLIMIAIISVLAIVLDKKSRIFKL